MSKARIVSNGTANSTQLLDANGDKFKGDIESIKIEITTEDHVQAEVSMCLPVIDCEVEKTRLRFVMYFAGKVREIDTITFKDGAVWNKDTFLP